MKNAASIELGGGETRLLPWPAPLVPDARRAEAEAEARRARLGGGGAVSDARLGGDVDVARGDPACLDDDDEPLRSPLCLPRSSFGCLAVLAGVAGVAGFARFVGVARFVGFAGFVAGSETASRRGAGAEGARRRVRDLAGLCLVAVEGESEVETGRKLLLGVRRGGELRVVSSHGTLSSINRAAASATSAHEEETGAENGRRLSGCRNTGESKVDPLLGELCGELESKEVLGLLGLIASLGRASRIPQRVDGHSID